MTETLFVFVTAFAGFLFVDPFYGGALTKASIAKVPILLLGYGTLVFHLVGRAIVAPTVFRAALAEVVRTWWPIIALGLWITAGGAYARWLDDIREGFLAMGLGMLFMPLIALALRSSSHSLGLMKTLGVVYLLTFAGMIAVLAADLHTFHEEIFIAVPLGAYFLTAPRLRWWHVIVGLALIGSTLISFKNTTFLIVLATLSVCVGVRLYRVVRRSEPLKVITSLYFGIPIILGSAAALYLTWKKNREALPSGNVEYRVEMYTIAWQRFLDSPIWGSLFTDSSVAYFELYRTGLRTNYLPTHSDVLDILAHGGLIGLALWVLVVAKLLRIGWDATRRLAVASPEEPLRAWRILLVLTMVQFGAVITYLFNPPLISPLHGFWIWGSAAVTWVLHRHLVAGPLQQKTSPAVYRGYMAA